MRLDPETRYRSILPLFAAVLGAVYLFVFVPIDRKARSLDMPLEQSWRKLSGALGQTNVLNLDFVGLTNQFKDTRAALTVFEMARKQAQARVELDDTLREQLSRPFFLVDYRNEAGRRMGTLIRLAKQENVILEPAVLAGFPEQSIDVKEPALLWAELAFLDSLLTTAIHAKVTTIHFIAAQMPLTNAPAMINGPSLAELPMQIELTGAFTNVARFLQTLPLRANEIRAAGLPEAPTNKPALFIDRLVLRKQAPEKPDEARLSLRVVGFVFQK